MPPERMTTWKNTTGVVGYIALLMIAWAGLWNPSHGDRMGELGASALNFRSASAIEYRIPEGKRMTVTIEGRVYEAILLSEVSPQSPGESTKF